jgi:hypothetical protein
LSVSIKVVGYGITTKEVLATKCEYCQANNYPRDQAGNKQAQQETTIDISLVCVKSGDRRQRGAQQDGLGSVEGGKNPVIARIRDYQWRDKDHNPNAQEEIKQCENSVHVQESTVRRPKHPPADLFASFVRSGIDPLRSILLPPSRARRQ